MRRTGEPPSEAELADAAHLRVDTGAGPVDLIREGDPPLDFHSGYEDRLDVELDGVEIPVAGLPLLTTLKRRANRPQDRVYLEELERIHGPLPVEPQGSELVRPRCPKARAARVRTLPRTAAKNLQSSSSRRSANGPAFSPR